MKIMRRWWKVISGNLCYDVRELLRDDEMFEEARSQIPGGGGRPKAAEVDPAARQITSFFKA